MTLTGNSNCRPSDANPLHCPTVYNVTFAREFRYDGARARYLNRELSPAGLLMNPPQFNSLSDIWTDYDGDSAYGDFEVTAGTPPVTNKRSYQPGLAQVDPWMSSGGSATDYVMSDLLGTARGLIDPNNVPTDAAVYTAFGERISGTNHRFGYVGSFGYQAHDEFPFLHVGARYYDPATGKFLQRDPIGIRGGSNVYAYVGASPTAWTDPDGLQGTMGKLKSGEVGYELGCHFQWYLGYHCCGELKSYPGDEWIDRRYRERHPIPAPPWHPPMLPPPEPPQPPPIVGPPAPPPPRMG